MRENPVKKLNGPPAWKVLTAQSRQPVYGYFPSASVITYSTGKLQAAAKNTAIINAPEQELCSKQ